MYMNDGDFNGLGSGSLPYMLFLTSGNMGYYFLDKELFGREEEDKID